MSLVGTSRLGTMPELGRMITAGRAGLTGLVVGAGGMGKTRVLDALATQGRDADLTVQLTSATTAGEDLSFPVADDLDLLLVDDAQLLNESAFNELLRIAEDRNRSFGLCVATRPAVDHQPLGRLIEVAERRGSLHELGPFSSDELGAALTTAIDAAVDASLFSAVLDLSAGHPLIVDRLISGWLELGHVDRGRLTGDPEPAPNTVERTLLGPIQQLTRDERALLAAIALGSKNETLITVRAHDLQTLQSHGLLLATGMIPPSIAHAALTILELADIDRGERLLADELTNSGADPTRIAEQFAEVSEPGNAAHLAWIDAGDALLDSDPEAAAEWYLRAQRVCGDNDVTARYAVACAAAEDEAAANQAIGEVLRSEPRNPRTLGAGAQIAARHGRWGEVADLLGAIEEHQRWSPTVVGVLERGASLLADRRAPAVDESVATDPIASMLDAAFTALQISLEHIPQTPKLTEAVRSLATRVGAPPGGADLPMNAFELGAVASVAVGELDMAEVLLESANQSLSGTSGSALHNWLRVRTGGQPQNNPQTKQAGTAVEDARADSPYAGLLDLAAQALHARRNGDVAASSDVLDKLRNVIALAPIDVLTFDAAAELMILARRFGSRTVLHTIEERLERFLEAHGNPPLWVVRVRWAELEAAVGTRDIELARHAAMALKEVGPTGPRLSALIDASSVWIDVLEERCDVETILGTAADLEQSGYSNEAALLVGQAAIRQPSPEDARRLLTRARELRGAPSSASGEANSPSGLSEREIEVAELILDGHSYKEIGSRLFISAKTVEHHSSHIRQKLDAVGVPRAVFLAALKTDLQR